MKIVIELDSVDELFELKKVLAQMKKLRIDTSQGIEMLDLMVRTQNCLKAENIKTIDQLLGWSPEQLLKTPNLGRKSLNEVVDKLAEYDLSLKAGT